MNEPTYAAMRLYPTVEAFHHDLQMFARLHRVIITPGAFILAKAVRRDTDPSLLKDIFYRDPEDEADAWFIWAAAGDLREILNVDTLGKEWVGFARRRIVRWRRIDHLRWKSRLNGSFPSPSSDPMGA